MSPAHREGGEGSPQTLLSAGELGDHTYTHTHTDRNNAPTQWHMEKEVEEEEEETVRGKTVMKNRVQRHQGIIGTVGHGAALNHGRMTQVGSQTAYTAMRQFSQWPLAGTAAKILIQP